jgi:hypothetical protein
MVNNDAIIKTKILLGGTTKNHLFEWLRNQKWPTNIHGPIFKNVFTSTIFFIHVYPLYAKLNGLNCLLERNIVITKKKF